MMGQSSDGFLLENLQLQIKLCYLCMFDVCFNVCFIN